MVNYHDEAMCYSCNHVVVCKFKDEYLKTEKAIKNIQTSTNADISLQRPLCKNYSKCTTATRNAKKLVEEGKNG